MTSALTPNETKEFITTALMCKNIPYIYGAPGIGKSDVMSQIADDFNLKLIDIRLSQMLPEDLTGLPRYNDDTGKAEYVPFTTFPMLNDEIPDNFEGWLIFLDELSSASEEVMAAIYSLLLGHTIGGMKLHKKALIVAAGNSASDSAIARELPDTLVTRLLPCEMKVNVKDWIKWAISDRTDANQTVVEFIRQNPDMLVSKGDSNHRAELETYATPRGWEKVSGVMNFYDRKGQAKLEAVEPEDKIPLQTKVKNTGLPGYIFSIVTSAVGVLSAQAFKEFYESSTKLPYVWDIAQSPASSPIPPSFVQRAELINELATYHFENEKTVSSQILQYINRMGGEEKALFVSVLANIMEDNVNSVAKLTKIKTRLGIQ